MKAISLKKLLVIKEIRSWLQTFRPSTQEAARNISLITNSFSSKSLELPPRYGGFRFFKMATAANLDFPNFIFLTVGTVKRVELRHRVKFRWNRPNRGQDIAIYRFFKMAADAILDFKNFKFLTVATFKRVKLHHCAKFRRNRSKRGLDM